MTEHPAGAESKGEVLVVDDTPTVRALLCDLLTAAGYSVRQAPDGELALWTVEMRRPELILLDVRMPGMDGFEVCRRLKADPSSSGVPVIFLSALDETEDKVHGLALGAVDYIAKPYQHQEVLARVHTQISLARLHRALESERALLESRVAERTAEIEQRGREMARILAALNMAGDGIAILTDESQCTYANQALLRTLGIGALDDIIGSRPQDIHADGAPTFDPAEIDTVHDIVGRVGTWRGELSLRRPGKEAAGRLLCHVRRLPTGERVAVLTDVTEERRREEERKRLETQLDQARKLEAIGQLAAGIAHDFNNYLGAILGYAQFIIDDSRNDESQHRYARGIVKAGQQAKSLIEQILAFSRRQESAMEPIDLAGLVDDTVKLLRPSLGPQIDFRVLDDADGKAVDGRRAQMNQLITNLIVNAAEALDRQPGTITVAVADPELSMPPLQRLYHVDGDQDGARPEIDAWNDPDGSNWVSLGSLTAEGRYLALSVSDTGRGMTADVAAAIFAPFFTTKGKMGGTGLGLAVVQNIVTVHGGALLVQTCPGKGTRFDVLLPLAANQERLDGETAQPVVPAASRASILLVDDSDDFGDMLTTALFRLGYEVSVCDTPDHALGYVREDPQAWDLVVTDLAMPRMNGTELVGAIKAIRPDLPCVICTAFPSDITEDVARQAGADGFATKPLDMGAFSLLLAGLLARQH